jgi:hypothetical protein
MGLRRPGSSGLSEGVAADVDEVEVIGTGTLAGGNELAGEALASADGVDEHEGGVELVGQAGHERVRWRPGSCPARDDRDAIGWVVELLEVLGRTRARDGVDHESFPCPGGDDRPAAFGVDEAVEHVGGDGVASPAGGYIQHSGHVLTLPNSPRTA